MRTFHGGIHPNDHKFGTADKPIIDLAPPEELVFPLSQHIGAPSIPCVSVGDTVLVGQKIADANGNAIRHRIGQRWKRQRRAQHGVDGGDQRAAHQPAQRLSLLRHKKTPFPSAVCRSFSSAKERGA